MKNVQKDQRSFSNCISDLLSGRMRRKPGNSHNGGAGNFSGSCCRKL